MGEGYISLFPHTFGYPVILSGFYKIFGSDYIIAQILNVLLGLGISFTLYYIGVILFDKTLGLLAALFWALWPSQILYCELVSTEALFTLLMLLNILIFLVIVNKERQSIAAILGLGILCALTNYIRPFGIILIFSFCIFLLLKLHSNKNTYKPIKTVIVSITILVISYIISSNIACAGISKIINKDIAKFPIGFNLLTGSNAKYSGTWNLEDSNILSEYDEGPFDAQDVQNKMKDIAIKRYKQQGFQNVILFYNKYNIIWASDDNVLSYIKSGLEQESSWFNNLFRYLKFACNIYYLLMMCFCCVFSIYYFKRKINGGFLVIITIILVTVATHLILEVAGRYHYPVISLFSLLASVGVTNISILRTPQRADSGSLDINPGIYGRKGRIV